MKTLLSCLLVSCVLAVAANAADVSGKWTGTFTPEGGDNGTAYVILKQTADKVTGSGGPDQDNQWPGLTGTVEGNKVTFEVKNPDDGITYKGVLVLNGDHLDGDVSFSTPDGQSMKARLNLTRVKA